jgi:ATP-dependent RNA helicase RhlE
VTPQSTTVEKIQQKVLYVKRENKMNLLLHLLKSNDLYKVLVFVDMKHVANKVSEQLVKNKVPSAAIHGNKSQGARQKAIEDFSKDRVRVLVATDIAARGIDIEGITHVINFDLPHLVESYVHRIGRTARAGAEGQAISFCTGYEKSYLFAIEKQTRAKIEPELNHPFHAQEVSEARVMSVGQAKAMSEASKNGRRQQSGRGGGRGDRRTYASPRSEGSSSSKNQQGRSRFRK